MSADIDRADEHSSLILRYLTLPNVGIFFLVYLVIYVAFSYVVPVVHGDFKSAGEFGDMFGVLNALASGLAMGGVALAVWLQRDQVAMQAKELKVAAQQATKQSAALKAQLETAQSQMNLEGKAYIERNKPIVFSDRVTGPNGVPDYVMRNVGGGFAINVYYIAEDVTVTPDGALSGVRALGSLAPNAERPFPDKLRRALCDDRESHPIPHILLAEGPFSRTTQWTATLNYRTAVHDPMEGHVRHRVAVSPVKAPRFKRQSLRTLARRRGDSHPAAAGDCPLTALDHALDGQAACCILSICCGAVVASRLPLAQGARPGIHRPMGCSSKRHPHSFGNNAQGAP
jgi:hypothetical protein